MEPLYKLVWMIACHWFWKIDNPPYEVKRRFSMCGGCKMDWHEYWHPSEEVKP